ncbi:MAG: DMT family transporter [Pseudomonadota bacterium]
MGETHAGAANGARCPRVNEEMKPWLGMLGGLVAVLIWSGWIVATRDAMAGTTDALILALMRNGLPALILMPVWLRRGLIPRGVHLPSILWMTLGWGAPFTLFVGAGLAHVPAGLFGPLVPGLAPLIVAGLAWAFFANRPGRGVILGLGLMAIALIAVLSQWISEGNMAEMQGMPYLLMASLGISIFTVNMPRSGLNPVEATAYICLYSLPIIAVFFLIRPDAFVGETVGSLAWHGLMQGIITGLGAVLAYGIAIRHLGAVRGSTANALVPVCAAIAAMAFLGESLTWVDWVAVFCSSLGVAAVNGAFRKWIGG